MATFIEEVAARLYEKYGDDVSSLTLVLPSKRARLFFAEALSKVAVHPIWEPNYISIDDLMCRLSNLEKCDRLRLVAELFKIYSRTTGETFDDFYHWGEVLVADFDMLDKYQVDAAQLFANISDLKELEAYTGYLDSKHIELINRFWHTMLSEGDGTIKGSVEKDSFLKVWRSLGAIYEEFRATLRKLGVGYTGMIYRDAVERLKQDKATLSGDERYVFVGFNALSECERALLEYMQQNCRVEFYWDYDRYYIENEHQEAGLFIRKNLQAFGEESGITHDNFRNIKSINVMSTSSNVAQCQCVVDILEKIASESGGQLNKDTAVVLTDENLLMPLLYALPEKFKKEQRNESGEVVNPAINVTMGYPLRNTLAYSFVERLLELQKHAQSGDDEVNEPTFYYVDVDGLLSHPYIADVSTSQYSELRAEIVKHRLFRVPASMLAKSPLLERIFRKATGWKALSEYLLDVVDAVSELGAAGTESATRTEFLAMVSDALSKLQSIAEQCEVPMDEIYYSLVRRYLQGERVPFTGEPLEGLQVMGLLETRNLDFKNVILLSMTDNNFPGSRASDKSFIPYSLRFGFNIPTAEHHEGVYAYYFYRLIERAENLYMLYSSAADGVSTGEPSRYIRQIDYETDFKIDYTNVGVEVSLSDGKAIEVEKSEEVFDKLLRFTGEEWALSPTAFSTYVKCPLKFYFDVVERLRSDDELDESVDNMTFGNIFHEAADLLYKQTNGYADPSARLTELREKGEVEKCVDKAIAKTYFGYKDGVLRQELGGELIIIRNIVREYLGQNLLNYDIKNDDFTEVATERKIGMIVPIRVGEESFDIHLAGRSDRIDTLKNGQLRVIDYKTGKPRLNYAGIESLFHGEPIATTRESNIINTLLYSMIISHNEGKDVRPELYYVGSMVRKDYSPRFVETIDRQSRTLDSYADVAPEFEDEVKETLREMFNRSIPFRQCEDDSACKYCDYQTICNRK